MMEAEDNERVEEMVVDQVASGSSDPVLPPSAIFRPKDFLSTDPMSESSMFPEEQQVRSAPLSEEYAPDSPKSREEHVLFMILNDREYAKMVLDGLPSTSKEWCELVPLQPTKKGGYIQISYGGANKVCTLQLAVLAANGGELLADQGLAQCSHLCHRPACKTVGHVIAESALDNNARKNCLVWINCHHCSDKVIFLCTHEPCCIKYHPGYSSMLDLQKHGVCRDLRKEEPPY